MYTMVCSCLNSSFTISIDSRYVENTSKEHWKIVQWILRYLQGSNKARLHFGRNTGEVIGYVDSDLTDLEKEDLLQVVFLPLQGVSVEKLLYRLL